MIPVPRDEIDAALAVLEAEVGTRMIGAYLYGSGVTGGLRPDRDLDLFGLIERRLRPAERRRIVEGLMPLSGRETRPSAWRPIELTLVVHGEVRPWRYPPRFELQYGANEGRGCRLGAESAAQGASATAGPCPSRISRGGR